MKKIVRFSIVVAVILALALCITACGGDENQDDNVTPGEQQKAQYYTVTFDSMGGSNVQPVQAEAGSTIAEPTAPSKSGNAFDGWYKDSNFQTRWNFAVDAVNKDTTLYAKWQPTTTAQYYTVTFDSMGGSNVQPARVEAGSKVAEPTEPSKGGYDFGGWYRDPDFQTEWNFDSDVVNENTTLYANWQIKRHTVTFNANGGKFLPDEVGTITVTVEDNSPVGAVYIPERDGYIFLDWYEDANATISWNSGEAITADKTIYAGWQAIQHTVTFDAQGGEFPNNDGSWQITVNENSTLDESSIPEPTLEGFEFTGWYLESEGEKWNFDEDVVTEETYLYAGWEKNVFTVSTGAPYSDAGNYTEYYEEKFTVGDTVTLTATSTDPRYTWVGWFEDETNVSEGSATYSFPMPKEDKHFIAKWIECPVTVAMRQDENAGSVSGLTDNPTAVGEDATVTATTNPGYTWVGWFKDGVKVSEGTSLSYTFEMTEAGFELTAKWIKVSVGTVLGSDPNGGTVTEYDKSRTYVAGDSATVSASANPGYTWVGWFKGDQKVSEGTSASYTFNMPEEDMTLTAKWIRVSVATDIEDSPLGYGGSYDMYDENKTYNVGDQATVKATAVSNEYTWVGWFKDDVKVSDGTSMEYTFNMPEENTTLTAKWIKFPIAVNNSIEEAGTVSGLPTGATAVGDELTLTAETKPGYTWAGWYRDGDKVGDNYELTYTLAIPEEKTTIVATWIACPITLTQDMTGVGTVRGVEGATVLDEQVTITAAGIVAGYVFDGWYEDDTKVSSADEMTYKFTMSEQSKVYEARWSACTSHTYENCVCTKCGVTNHDVGDDCVCRTCKKTIHGANEYCQHENEVYFGSYPQSEVKDGALKTTLTANAGALPTAEKSQSWTSYEYYMGVAQDRYTYVPTVVDYMWYIDVDYNGEKYRGVYFTSYRPQLTYSESTPDYSSQDDNGYTIGNVYWFTWEPIKWRVLSSAGGELFLHSDKVLDSRQYYHGRKEDIRNIDGKKVYANNYKESDIRAWLNDGFYNAAFASGQKALIQQTLVDNSEASLRAPTVVQTSPSKVCEDTNDNIFLLSYQDVKNKDYGFVEYPDASSRVREVTDYAKCQGMDMTSESEPGKDLGGYWLRSPNSGSDDSVSDLIENVKVDGTVSNESWCYRSDRGVCPALKIKVQG